MRIRTAAAVALLAAFSAAAAPASAGPRRAAPPLTFRDAQGDTLGQDSVDITSVTLRTTGRTGRGGYRPSAMVVTMRLAAAPSAPAGVTYRLHAEVAGCGFFDLVYAPGTVYARTNSDAWLLLECGKPSPTVAGALVYVTPVRARLSGRTLTWTVPLGALPGARLGTAFSSLRARTEVAEPVTGFLGSGYGDPSGALDVAETDRVWHLG